MRETFFDDDNTLDAEDSNKETPQMLVEDADTTARISFPGGGGTNKAVCDDLTRALRLLQKKGIVRVQIDLNNLLVVGTIFNILCEASKKAEIILCNPSTQVKKFIWFERFTEEIEEGMHKVNPTPKDTMED